MVSKQFTSYLPSARIAFVSLISLFALHAHAASLHVEGTLDVGNPVPPASDTVSKNSTVAPLTANLSDSYRENNGAASGAGAALIANYGKLSVNASGTGSKTGANVLSGPGAFQALTATNPVASFSDSITVTSATLPNDAAVVFHFTLVLSDTITQDNVATATVSGDLSANVAGGNNIHLSATTNSQTVSNNLSVHVGDVINLSSGLHAAGSVSVGALHPGQSDSWLITGPQGYATVTIFIDSFTTGASYTAASGTNYPTSGSVIVPQLTIKTSGANFIISWPSTATGYQLQQNSALNKNAWVNVTGTTNDDGTFKSVQVPRSTGNLFYRLKK